MSGESGKDVSQRLPHFKFLHTSWHTGLLACGCLAETFRQAPGVSGSWVGTGSASLPVRSGCRSHPALLHPEWWRDAVQVVGSRADTVVQTFATLLPDGTPQDFQRVVELKVRLDAGVARLARPSWEAAGRGTKRQ